MAEPVGLEDLVKHSEDWIRFQIQGRCFSANKIAQVEANMWCVEDWVFAVQQVPPRPQYLKPTTCALPNCKYDGNHFGEYTFRVSFEPLSQWNKCHIVQEPITPSKVEGQDSELGTSVTRSFWYHLDCLEGVFDRKGEAEDALSMLVTHLPVCNHPSKAHESLGLHIYAICQLYTGASFSLEPIQLIITCPAANQTATRNVPLAEFAKSIFAEARGHGPLNTNFSLGYELHYLLEKWTGIHLYQDLIDECGLFNEKKAMAIHGKNLTIMDTGIYTSILSVFRRNMVESAYHFHNLPDLLEVDGIVKGLRLSQVLQLGEPWAWQVAHIDELCMEYRRTRRLNGEDAEDLDGETENTDSD